MVGIRPDGVKEVMGYAIAPSESTITLKELLEDMVSRCVQPVLLFVTNGFKDTIHQVFPNEVYQHCCVHVSHNLASNVREADQKNKR